MIGEKIFLVTGAAGGQQGSTGARIVSALLAKGHRVRAFVHQEDARAESLRSKGAEVILGDLLLVDTVRTALKDVSAVYFAYPVKAGLLQATTIVASLANECGVKHIVNLSQASANHNALSPTSREHWLAERILDLAPTEVTHVRGAVFFENIFRQTIEAVRHSCSFGLPMGTGNDIVPSVAASDVADVAAAVLQSPESFAGKTLVVTGPEALTPRRMAADWSIISNSPVRYQALTDEEQCNHLLRLLGRENLVQILHLTKLWTLLREAHIVEESPMGRISPVYESIVHRPGTTWKRFLMERLPEHLSETVS